MPRLLAKSSAVATSAVLALVSSAAMQNSDAPSLDAAVDAWIKARAWVDALRVPSVTPAPAATPAPVVPPGSRDAQGVSGAANGPGGQGAPVATSTPSASHSALGAVGVVLRLRGRVVGTGLSFGSTPGLLERAVSQAIDAVGTDDFVLSLPRDDRGSIGRELAIELELASEPAPMIGRTVGQIVSRIEPALEAHALRRGDRWTWTMPCVVQAANLASDPVRSCAVMLQQVSIDPRELPSQALPDGTVFYRAPTRRLAQLGPKGAPFEVTRGHEIIPLTAVGPVGRSEFATAMARHLRAHITRPSASAPNETNALKALGIRGDYRPHLDHHRELAAPPADQALAAFALASAARSPLLSDEERRQSAEAAATLLVALADVAEVEEPPLQSPSAVALALLADDALDRCGMPVAARSSVFITSLREALAARLGADGEFDHGRAIELAAAASLAARGHPILDDASLDARLLQAWSAPPSTTLVGMLPWLLLAERERGALSDPDRTHRILERAEPVRRALIASQLGVGGPEEPAPDAAGGFALTGGVRPMATSQSARPTLALALMLASPAMATPDQLPDLLRSQLMALRFLRQLAVDERSCYAFRDPARTTGGVRDALWDSTQPVAATAISLLAVVESETALRAAAARSRASAGKSGNLEKGSSGVNP